MKKQMTVIIAAALLLIFVFCISTGCAQKKADATAKYGIAITDFECAAQ